MKMPHSSLFTLFFALAIFAQPRGDGFAQTAAEELPNPGPRSASEPAVLWDEIQASLPSIERANSETSTPEAKAELRETTKRLERLINRYPRDPHAAEATETLARLQLRAADLSKAISTAKQFLHLDSNSERAQRVRLTLIDAYLGRNQLTEARATAKELLAKSKDDLTRGRALLALAKVETRLGKYSEARARLDALPEGYPVPERDAQLLEIGVRECSTTITAPKKNVRGDDPWIEYFEKKNLCWKALAASQQSKPTNPAQALWCDRFRAFSQELASRSINSFQKTRLQAELAKTSDLAKPMNCETRP